VAFAFVLLGQRPGPLQLVGGVLILAGIVLVQQPVKPKNVLEQQTWSASHQ
jgi:drug/metabolite transporter (DMT)-like permease